MQVTVTYKPTTRAEWRAWLEQHHRTASEIWLLFADRPEAPTVAYLDAVEAALCFGWIDGLQKRVSPYERADAVPLLLVRRPAPDAQKGLCASYVSHHHAGAP